MLAESRIILWLSGMLLLGVGILLGFILTRRTGKKNAHIQELEEQLVQSRKELEEYRALVNEHFMKTSELVDQMTASYRAIFMHLANGAQTLSGQPQEAALKLPEDEMFAHAQPLERSPEESEALPETKRQEAVAGSGEEIEPEKGGQTISRETFEKTATTEESAGAEAQPQDEQITTKTEEVGVESEDTRKDENT